MLFNSFQYLIFLPIIVCAYFSLPHRFRWMLLLAGSYYFYGCWRVEYLTLIMLTTVVDWLAGRYIAAAETLRGKRAALVASLCVNMSILFAFKYFNFAISSIQGIFNYFNVLAALPELKVLLPVGISFYTFQSASYVVDVYRGKLKPQPNLGMYALYVSFFPQLVAGPIERSTNLMPQLFANHGFDRARAASGLRLILWGLLKKVAIADRLAYYVNTVYSSPADYGAGSLLLATYFFAYQIYCDFSGYSDIAIGSARIMGFELMTNFRRPYLSRSIAEFWRRWHISLSTWFRDYVYIALGGNRVTKGAWRRNIIATFVLSGLWHGANWTFIVWGFLHGASMVLSDLSAGARDRVAAIIRVERIPFVRPAFAMLTTFHLVLISWVFFRAGSVSEAWIILVRIAEAIGASFTGADAWSLSAPFAPVRDIWFLIALIVAMSAYEWATAGDTQSDGLAPAQRVAVLRHPLVKTAVLSLQFWFIVAYGMFNNKQFIYFQF